MVVQERISRDRLRRSRWCSRMVLVDEVIETDTIVARSYADAPEIDGKVYMDFVEGVSAGDFVEVEIIDSDYYDLIARVVTEPGD
jgi:ribosomal protein S12 methylthiotransferase